MSLDLFSLAGLSSIMEGFFFQIPGAYVVPEDASTFLHLLCGISDVDWGLEDVGC